MIVFLKVSSSSVIRCSTKANIQPNQRGCHLLRWRRLTDDKLSPTDGCCIKKLKQVQIYRLLLKAPTLVAFPSGGRGTTKWWMRCSLQRLLTDKSQFIEKRKADAEIPHRLFGFFHRDQRFGVFSNVGNALGMR